MNNRYWGAGAIVLLGFLTSLGGCSSGRTVCELICDCSHCNDFETDLVCFQFESQEAVAEAYDCAEQWEAQMTCIQEKGTCDEEKAEFETRGPSTCSDTQDVGVTCMTAADCSGVGNPDSVTCTANTCVIKVCSGNGGSCSVDSDCTGSGAELCEAEQIKVQECISKASGEGGPGFF